MSGLVQVSPTEAFGVHFVAPVLARLQRQHPELLVELVIATRPLLQTVGADIEVVVGQPGASRSNTVRLTEYRIGMYAAPDYLERRGMPRSPHDLGNHTLVFYIEPLIRITDLHIIQRHFPDATIGFASTNVFAHVEATKAGSGIGLLPAFLRDREPGLVRLFPDEVSSSSTTWPHSRRACCAAPRPAWSWTR